MPNPWDEVEHPNVLARADQAPVCDRRRRLNERLRAAFLAALRRTASCASGEASQLRSSSGCSGGIQAICRSSWYRRVRGRTRASADARRRSNAAACHLS